ncbi:MFS transporter [Arcanobacterium hippocoleae]|uniref:MFS family permease n=1 Tax=Arcanobacterium hippocoleae TaxID=149017 RepID=A0ABU1T476_9ACTO|nr:MFS transporter [Arcanobacterium hippocoleae]MDR6939676.1 MFS family permease [Arcanobacterium hippocoleae]
MESRRANQENQTEIKKRKRTVLPKEIWVLVAASVSIALGYGIVAPVLPQFAKSFNVTNFAATLVVSVFAFMRLAFAPAAGLFSNRFNERNVYLLGISIVSISSLTAAFATNYWQLLIFRGVGGIGSVMFSVSAMSLIFQWAPDGARGRASAAYGSGFLIGSIAGPAVGSLLAPFGYRPPFVIYAIFLAIAAVIVAVMIPGENKHKLHWRTRKQKHDPVAGSASSACKTDGSGQTDAAKSAEMARPSATQETITVKEAWAIGRFKVILLTSFAQGWTNMGVRLSIVPLLAGTIAGAPVWLAGGMLTAFAAGNGTSLFTAGRWSDIYGRRRLVVAGLLLSGIFTIFTGDVTNTWLLIGMSALAGYGSGLIQPSQQGALADIVGKKNGGSVVSLFQQSADFGSILGPIAAGLVVDFAGFSPAYWISGGVLITVAIGWIFFTHGR